MRLMRLREYMCLHHVYAAAPDLLQASKVAVGGDKLPPPITPEHNPLSVPGQDQLNGNELHGHPSNEGDRRPLQLLALLFHHHYAATAHR